MPARLLTGFALILAVWAAREVLRRRVVLVRGRRGSELAPAILFSFWLCGLLAGELTGCVTSWHVITQMQDAHQRHDIGGDLRRNLAAAAAREPIFTTADRVDDLVMVGFTVIAPFTSRNVASFSRDDFDGYAARNANRAAWWSLPEHDARVRGRHVEGRDRDYVLVRSAPGNPR